MCLVYWGMMGFQQLGFTYSSPGLIRGFGRGARRGLEFSNLIGTRTRTGIQHLIYWERLRRVL